MQNWTKPKWEISDQEKFLAKLYQQKPHFFLKITQKCAYIVVTFELVEPRLQGQDEGVFDWSL